MRKYLALISWGLTACSPGSGDAPGGPGPGSPPNAPPSAQITSPSPGAELVEGQTVTLRGHVLDDESGPVALTARWLSGGTELCASATPGDDGTTTCEASFEPSASEVTLEVFDARQARGAASLPITVRPDAAPEATVIAPGSTGTYYTDQRVLFEGRVADDEDAADTLSVAWTSDLDGLLAVGVQPSSGGEVSGAAWLSEGTHVIELRAEDRRGNRGTDSVLVQVGPPNSAPSCALVGPEASQAFALGDTIALAGVVGDADVPASELAVVWSSDREGDLAAQTPNARGEVSLFWEPQTRGAHLVGLTATDEVGAICSDHRTLRVSARPRVVLSAPTPGSLHPEGAPLSFVASVSDAEDAPQDLMLSWELDGRPFSTQGASASGEASLAAGALAVGVHELVVTVTDLDGLTATAPVQFVVDGRPSTPTLSLSPEAPTTEDDLTVVVEDPSVDPEGAGVTYRYAWLADGVVQLEHTEAVLPAAATRKGHRWTARVTPSDGLAEGVAAVATTTIVNAPPRVTGVAVLPADPVHNDATLSCVAEVTDPDELPSTRYEWLLGSQVVGLGATLDLTTQAVGPGDVVTCRALAEDADGATGERTEGRGIANRPPTISTVTVLPATGVTTHSELSCDAVVEEPDGENPSTVYTWQVGSTRVEGPSLSLHPSLVAPGGEVTCVATARDGHGGEVEAEASVEVENLDPLLSDVALAYDGELTSRSLVTCEHTASDPDLEDLEAAYVWTNVTTGQVLEVTSQTLQLEATLVRPLEQLECAVIVSDPQGATAELRVSETVVNSEPWVVVPAAILTEGQQVGGRWTCTAEAEDPDDGALEPAYVWQDEDGSEVGRGPELLVTADNSTPEASIACVATFEDAHGGIARSTASAVVENTAPRVQALAFESVEVYTEDVISVSAEIVDPDATDDLEVLYDWYVTDAASEEEDLVQSGPDATLDGALHFERGDSVRVVVTPSDALDTGRPEVSDVVVVANSAPMVGSVLVGPDPAYASYQDLTCVGHEVSDADGDEVTLTYAWTHEGGTTFEGGELQAARVTAGLWTCSVEASEPGASSSWSASLLVQPSSCDGISCGVGGECVSGGATYTCSCREGFEGTHCEADVDECAINNGGCGVGRPTCVNTAGSHFCIDDSRVLAFPEASNLDATDYHKVAVVLVNGRGPFPTDRDDYYESPTATYRQSYYDADEVGHFLFDSPDGVRSYFEEISHGKANLSGVVVEWYDDYDVPRTSMDIFYDHDVYIAEAYPAIDPTQYDIFMIVGLAESGVTQIGWGMGNSVPDEDGGRLFGKGLTYLINSSFMNEVGRTRFDGWVLPSVPWAHELFHTLGIFGHSNSLWCYPSLEVYEQSLTAEALHMNASVSLSPTCQSKGYGDPYSLMGERLWATHPSAASKVEMGWIDASDRVELEATGGLLEETVLDLYPHNRSTVEGPVVVQLAVPELEVRDASGFAYRFDRVTLETRVPEGFDVYLNALGVGHRPYGTLAYWYLEGQWGWSAEHSENYYDLDEPIDTTGVLVYLDHTDTSSEAVYLLDGNPANLGSLYDAYSPKGHQGNAGKFANAMVPVGGSLQSDLLPFSLEVETGELGGALGEVRVRIVPKP